MSSTGPSSPARWVLTNATETSAPPPDAVVSTTDVSYRAFVTAVRRANLEATGAVP